MFLLSNLSLSLTLELNDCGRDSAGFDERLAAWREDSSDALVGVSHCQPHSFNTDLTVKQRKAGLYDLMKEKAVRIILGKINLFKKTMN